MPATVQVYQRKVLRKRVPQIVDTTDGILAYDRDNLYPQRTLETLKSSYTTQSAVGNLGDFLYGRGFVDPALASLVMNSKGETANKILSLIAPDDATFNGYGFIVNYNLNYKISDVRRVKFEYIRYGVPDMWGECVEAKVSNNWERDPYKLPDYDRHIRTYPLFNPDPNVVREQIAAYGGILEYPGQIFYCIPEEFNYPLSTFDVVMDQAQTQDELGVFDLASIQNGLTMTTLVKWPGTFDTENEKAEVAAKFQAHKGAQGANSTMIIENPTGEDFDMVENLTLPNVDKLHEAAKKDSKDAIRETFSQPMEIQGIAPQNGMFNRAQIQEAYEYYNTRTQIRRDKISENFARIINNWAVPVNAASTAIATKTYGQANNQPTGPQSTTANG